MSHDGKIQWKCYVCPPFPPEVCCFLHNLTSTVQQYLNTVVHIKGARLSLRCLFSHYKSNIILYVALALNSTPSSWLWPIFLMDPAHRHRPLFQLLLYSDESVIYSICSSAVMLTVHFKESLQMKEFLSYPLLPLLFPFLREIWELSLWYQCGGFSLREQNVSTVTRTCDSQGSRQDSWGSLTAAVKKRTTAKCLIFVISVISKRPGVKLFLAPQFKPLLFIFWPWN